MDTKVAKLWTKPLNDFRLEVDKVLIKGVFTKDGKK